MIIGCVWTGDKFSNDYVINLYAMVCRCVNCEFQFVALHESEKELPFPHSYLRLREDLWGWWNLMQFYAPALGNVSRLYFGLDTVIRKDITEQVSRNEHILALDLSYLIGNPNPLYAGTFADAPALIPAGGIPWLWEAFLEEHAKTGLGSSQFPMHVWVTRRLQEKGLRPKLWQDLDPKFTTSYKWPTHKIEEPEEATVHWHGEPMLHQCLEEAPWIKKYWHSEDL